jgi:hypothetical protein
VTKKTEIDREAQGSQRQVLLSSQLCTSQVCRPSPLLLSKTAHYIPTLSRLRPCGGLWRECDHSALVRDLWMLSSKEEEASLRLNSPPVLLFQLTWDLPVLWLI